MPDRELCRYWFVFVCVIVEDFSAWTMVNYGDEAGVSDTCDQKKGTGKGTESGGITNPSGANTQAVHVRCCN